ncbi:hypothetical protein OBBRIDRAFT_791353 [Obba rivulosa]|uniref:Uncharacterized protein n=1 Tax=Obba rivulosa TaxID=1052685 RepID=A0A8E2B1P7_9APHY|nr:hypothetical protein OBBRIDRAFT_791353 [Obba rivulosa]
MPAILEALRLKPKPVELKIVYKSWSKAPRFQGKLKKDGPVDDWLGKIKAGCIEHGIPREQWHVVAQHYMGKKALKRFREMDRVMQIMHNGKYTWNWKKYKIAMRNMGWDINAKETKSLTVERKSGLWTVVDGLLHPQSQPNSPAPPKRSSSSSFMSRINSQSDDGNAHDDSESPALAG